MDLELVREALARGATVRLRVFGDSMRPSLVDGAQVEIHPIGWGGVQRGDVVAWTRGEQLVVHRVVQVRAGEVITQGDARDRSDPPLPMTDLLGRVSRPGGRPIRRRLNLRQAFRRLRRAVFSSPVRSR